MREVFQGVLVRRVVFQGSASDVVVCFRVTVGQVIGGAEVTGLDLESAHTHPTLGNFDTNLQFWGSTSSIAVYPISNLCPAYAGHGQTTQDSG